jgi:hypothetical protein
MPYPANLSGSGAGLALYLRRVQGRPPQTPLVGVGLGCQVGAWSWPLQTLMVPGQKTALRVRPSDGATFALVISGQIRPRE